eukprot:gene24467-biopygen19425
MNAMQCSAARRNATRRDATQMRRDAMRCDIAVQWRQAPVHTCACRSWCEPVRVEGLSCCGADGAHPPLRSIISTQAKGLWLHATAPAACELRARRRRAPSGRNGSGRGPDAGRTIEFKGTGADRTRAEPFLPVPVLVLGARRAACCLLVVLRSKHPHTSQSGRTLRFRERFPILWVKTPAPTMSFCPRHARAIKRSGAGGGASHTGVRAAGRVDAGSAGRGTLYSCLAKRKQASSNEKHA